MAEKLFLLDGHSLLYQAFYAMKGRGMTAPDGRPVNAVYIFTTMLTKIMREHKPDYIAAAFDEAEPTFRHELYEEYKANRQKPPDELIQQLTIVKDIVKAHGIPIYTLPGREADDVIGTIAKKGAEKGLDVTLVMSDKDARQLLAPNVSMMNSKTGEILTAETLEEQDGLKPHQYIDVMALAGDSSDNVPGVRGVGPKTAISLIKTYGSLDRLLDNLGSVAKKKLREDLKEKIDIIRLSRKLVTIDTNAPIDFDLESCRPKPDEERLRELLESLNFKSLMSGLDAPGPTREEREYVLVDSEEKLEKFIAELAKQKRFAFDVETTSVNQMEAELVGMSFSWKPKQAFYLPVRGPAGDDSLDMESTLDKVRPYLASTESEKVGQNLKYDIVVMKNHGCDVVNARFDTMIAAYCIDPTRRRYGMDDLAFDMLGYRKISIASIIGKGKNQRAMDEAPVAQVCEYACEDADIALRLADHLAPKLEEAGVRRVFDEIDMPLAPILAEMEYNGVGFDANELEKMAAAIDEKLADLEKRIHDEAGENFNVASPKQLAAILFEKLGLPVARRTKSGPSTDAEVLSELAIEHRLPALVLEYRRLSKLQNTYIRVLPKMVLAKTGRIHASFNQASTATGRLSSSEPNLQQIPIRTDFASQIRRAFVPSEDGWVMLRADYSQIELRVLAHFSGDEKLIEAFRQDEDIHAFVAAQVFGVGREEVNSDMRRVAKAVNFGIIYGQTPYGLSRSLAIPIEQAENFINEYFKRYSGVRKFIDDALEKARMEGKVATLRGRTRPVPDINSEDRNIRSFAERAAVNTIIQGTAADMIKLAMIGIDKEIRQNKFRSKMALQIHDELVFETPEDELELMREIVTERMCEAEELRAPVKVDMGVGPNWLDAE